ncbi:hypothetical protein [Bifidobacterium pseudolongum]|uniref:hypothetical protein n=1 Tax=Bifidobacterium pseudolongum TaxID=1694 RepID=UPI0013EC5DAE|nr:hypothetical protein [Bifidobacterium pseudolongum]
MRHATAPIAQPRVRACKAAGAQPWLDAVARTVAKRGIACMGWRCGVGGVCGW